MKSVALPHRVPDLHQRLSRPVRRKAAAFLRARSDEQVELVPSGAIAFAVVGGPNSFLDLYWIASAGLYRLRDVARARRLPASVIEALDRRLRSCIAGHAGAERHPLAPHAALVLSDSYGMQLRRLVSEVVA